MKIHAIEAKFRPFKMTLKKILFLGLNIFYYKDFYCKIGNENLIGVYLEGILSKNDISKLFIAKNKIWRIRNLKIFREPVKIFNKFQNWHIWAKKLFGVYFETFFSKMTFSYGLWQKVKFAKFAICQFFTNQLRYLKKFKTGILGMKNELGSFLSFSTLKWLFLVVNGKKQNAQNLQFANCSRTNWDIQNILKLAYRGWKINWGSFWFILL